MSLSWLRLRLVACDFKMAVRQAAAIAKEASLIRLMHGMTKLFTNSIKHCSYQIVLYLQSNLFRLIYSPLESIYLFICVCFIVTLDVGYV